MVRNIGPVASPACAVTYRLDTVTGTVAVTGMVPALDVAQSVTVTTAWSHGSLPPAGQALVAVVNEREQCFAEAYTGNNQASVIVMAAGKSQVVVALAVSSTSPKQGEPVTATFAVRNVGCAPLLLQDLYAGVHLAACRRDALSDKPSLMVQ